MENKPEKRRIKWRLNLFDVIFITCALIAAVLIINYATRSSGGVSLVQTGSMETVNYTIELQGMRFGTAELVAPGDSIIDRTERRSIGTVVSVELRPSFVIQKNYITGERFLAEVPDRTDAIITVRAQAMVTDSQISVDGFALRVGARVSATGPTYHSVGFISHIERSETP